MMTALLAAAVGTLALSATPSLPGFHLVATSARVDYFAMSDSKARPGDALAVEQRLEAIERQLGQRGPERLAYYLVGHPADMERLTRLPLLGVTDREGRRIISCVAVHAHELVHAVALQMGDPGRFFQEGLAVALSSDPAWSAKRVREGARRGLGRRDLPHYWTNFDGAPTDEAYAVAGGFVSHLVEQYGLPRVLEFFRGCGNCPSDEAFQRTFGVRLAEAGASWSTRLLD